MTWITNHPRSIKGLWPRRSVTYIEGEPKATDHYSVGELKRDKIIGVYIDMDMEEYKKLPLINADGSLFGV